MMMSGAKLRRELSVNREYSVNSAQNIINDVRSGAFILKGR